MSDKKKAKGIKLTLTEKQKVERIFEPLLSETFGGSNYHKYNLKQAKEIIENHINENFKNISLSEQTIIYVSNKLSKIKRATDLIKVLEIISELCLLEEELTEDC